jgi:hypothetical protein
MSNPTDLQKLMTTYRRRLQKLKETQAMYGLSAPPHVLLEIEDIEVKLAELQAELEQKQAELQQTHSKLTDMADQGLPVAEALSQVQQELAAVKTLLVELGQKGGGSGVTIGHVYGNIIGSTIAGRDVVQPQTTVDQRGQQVGAQSNISAGAGSVVNASAGGDIITGSGNQVIKPGGDYVQGDKIKVGNVSHAAVAVGRGAQATLNQGVSGEALAEFFATLYRQIDSQPGLSAADKEDAKAELAELEAAAKAEPDGLADSFLTRRLRHLERIAPDIIDVILATLANPGVGLGVVGAKIKAKAEEISAARG